MNLNPCPHCESEDVEIFTGAAGGKWCACQVCFVYGPNSNNEQDAASGWNRMSDRKSVGLTLREYAALTAMNGFLANPDRKAQDPEMVARWSVQHADAVIRALRQNGGK